MSPEQKLQIAIKLDELGIDAIEAGFPIVSEGEKHAIKSIVRQGLRAEICGLARTVQEDIDAALRCDLGYIHLFIATSDIHMKFKLKMDRNQVLEKAMWAVDYAKKHGVQVEFSAEDATRSEISFMKEVFQAVSQSGADRLDIPDTVGYSTPESISKLVTEVTTISPLPISMHCHDDLGLAVANTIAGINAGATCAQVTVNGIGERAGNASLEEVVSNAMGIIVQPNKAIIGENAFGHESGIHTHGIINNPLTYEPISPELVGRKRWLQAGKHAGAHGIRAMLEEFGLKPNDEQLKQILERQKDIADLGKSITTSELLSIAGKIMKNSTFQEKFQLRDFHTVTGINIIPTAVVKINTGDKDVISSEIGVGPVDAALKAIQKIVSQLEDVKIREYRLESITGGSDATAEVVVKIEDSKGHTISSRKTGEDIVIASVQAMMDATNKMILRKLILSRDTISTA